jgi:hypothetical protein
VGGAGNPGEAVVTAADDGEALEENGSLVVLGRRLCLIDGIELGLCGLGLGARRRKHEKSRESDHRNELEGRRHRTWLLEGDSVSFLY